MHLRLLHLIIILTLLAPALLPARTAAEGDGRPEQVVIEPDQGQDLASGGYLSPPTATARPFTHMLLRREATVPEGAELALFVRVSVDGVRWSDWGEVHDNEDAWRPEDGPDVEWSQTIDAGAAARYWQVRAERSAGIGGARPVLRRIDVNTIDAFSFGPARVDAARPPRASSLARPPVVSRVGWGSPDGQGSRVPPAYYPVNHLVVHHTADSNTLLPSEPNWAARVRAEWAFHTHTRGWGDIGYNYLIDPNGVIYEGRAGGDDAVAFHDTGNYGSMGVVLIGTYSSVPPTSQAQDALVDLLSWKAAQKRIDPLGRSYYYGCAISRYCYPFNAGAVVANIAGHRQVTPGHTSCPGDQTMTYLPGVRNRVKQRLTGGGGDNGDLTVDELENGFARSQANWRSASCGYGGHTYWTYATDGAAENTATWRPNIPSAGTYRIYAHIPQGCGLAPPPYASAQARYTITYDGGAATRVVDHNTASEWVDLGSYPFGAGMSGAVELRDDTGEPLSAGKVIFFDAIRWVPESTRANVALLGARYDRTTIASGELLRVTFTIQNTGDTTIYTQEPQAGTDPEGNFNDGLGGRPDDSYVYDEGECFLGDNQGSYASFPKETDRFRVTLGPTDIGGIACAGGFGNYPWRWGLNGALQPGAIREIVGYVRFRNEGFANRTVTLQAGLIQEYVRYFAEGVAPTTITVTPERFAPAGAAYDELLRPLAHVYRLGSMPDNFLARTRNPLSIPRGNYVGSFAWDGSLIDWGSGGPLGLADQFLIEQVRGFIAPTSGRYTFRTTSDDGSWLWVDGQPVVVNNGLHPAREVIGTIDLSAGVHILSFKYFERGGLATTEYSVQHPGSLGFGPPLEALASGALRFGGLFAEHPNLALAADDPGGLGVDRIRWSWNGTTWNESPGAILRTGRLQNGSYRLRYQTIDRAGNWGSLQEFSFRIDTSTRVVRSYAPLIMR